MSEAQPLPPALSRPVAELESAFSGRLSLYVQDLRRAESYGLNHHHSMRAASTIKLFVLWELMRQVEEGHLSLEDGVLMSKADRVTGSGVIADLTPGLRLSVGDAATLMITVSDNTATNLLLDRVGTRNVNRTASLAGFSSTHLAGKLFSGRGVLSTTTAFDLGSAMAAIARGRAVSREASTRMLAILKREQYSLIVGRLIPYDPWSPKGWVLASKSGSLRGCRNDVAYVRSPRARYVIALMSDGCEDPRPQVDNEATLCLARVAALVHEHCSR